MLGGLGPIGASSPVAVLTYLTHLARVLQQIEAQIGGDYVQGCNRAQPYPHLKCSLWPRLSRPANPRGQRVTNLTSAIGLADGTPTATPGRRDGAIRRTIRCPLEFNPLPPRREAERWAFRR